MIKSHFTPGTIIKGIGGFYYIKEDEDGTITCARPKGVFRKQGLTPMVGDRVEISKENVGENSAVIEKILPRKNKLIRPAVANATVGLIVVSIHSPDLSSLILDKMLLVNALSNLNSKICFNKIDFATDKEIEDLKEVYTGSGADLYFTGAKFGIGMDTLLADLKDSVTIVSGVSGAGKSTLISHFCPDAGIKTDEVSVKTKRGKNTTRHSEIFPAGQTTFLVDTPGFSSFDVFGQTTADALWKYYPEFYEYSDCRFSNCLHLKEPGCNVKAAVDENLISPIRYKNYKTIFAELLTKPQSN
jgi:ribosome biogenesis GTPase